MTEDLLYKVEAVLFAAGKFMDVEHIAQLIEVEPKDVRKVLKELKKKYDELDSSIIIVDEGKSWKMHVKRKYVDLVSKIVADTELSKTVLETLAIVAWKSPILQSEVISIRTSKAYEHIKELVESGYIIKVSEGRSYRLRVTEKFFEYFDIVDKNGVTRLFKDVQQAYDQLMKRKRAKALEEGTLEEEGEEEPIVKSDKIGKMKVYSRKTDPEVVSVNEEGEIPNELLGMAVVDMVPDTRKPGDGLAHLDDPDFVKYDQIKEQQEAEQEVVKEHLSEIDTELDAITSRNDQNEEDLRSFKRVEGSEETGEQTDIEEFLEKIDDDIDEISGEKKEKEE